MVRLLREPRGQAALAYVLAKDPPWRPDFFQSADASRVDPNAALRLLRLVARSRGSDVGPERQFYLRSLMAHGQSGTARTVWLNALDAQERARSRFVFDGDFSGTRSSPPFGWSLTDSDAGRAEIVAERGASGHLDVVYFGNQPAVLAEQALALAPGTYRIQVAARREAEAQSQLLWSVSCPPDDKPIGELELQGLQAEYRPISAIFAVPAGCSGQRLRLRGVPGDVSGRLTVQIGRLEITRVR
jgi:hypothetical protein